MSIIAENNYWNFNRIVFFLLVSYYSLSTIMPAISQFISAYIYMGTVVLLSILIIMRSYENFNFYLKFISPLLLLIFLQILNTYVNKTGSIPLFIYGKLLFLIPIVLMYYLLVNNNRHMIRFLVLISFIAFVITAVTTYFGLLNNPDASRILATIEDSKDTNAVYWGKLNIGGFDTIYSIVLLMPILVCLLKQRKINLLLFSGITIVFFLCLLEAQYATAFLLFLSSMVLIFVKRVFKAKDVFITLILLGCLYLIFKVLLAQLIFNLASTVESRTLSERFTFLSDSIQGIDTNTDVKRRFDLYMLSINYFIKYPITGSWIHMKYGSGGHSFILDTLAQFGILGGIALYYFFRQIFVKLYLPFKNTEYFGYLVWSFLIFLFLSAFNPTGFLIVLCFIVPGIAYIIQEKDYKIGERGIPVLESNVGM